MSLPNKETKLTTEKINFFTAFLKYYIFRLLFSQILYINNTNQLKVHFFLQQQFYKDKSLDFGKKKFRRSQEQSQACCPTEQKNKVSRLPILKILRTKHQNRAWLSLILYCQAGHYSAQSGKLSNLCFLTGYRTLTGQKTFFALGSFLEISQGHVTAYVIICGQQKLKVYNFQI